MGNVVSAISCKTLCVVGAIAVTIAKPTCELVLRGTEDIVEKQLNTTLQPYFDNIYDKLSEISDIQNKQKAEIQLFQRILNNNYIVDEFKHLREQIIQCNNTTQNSQAAVAELGKLCRSSANIQKGEVDRINDVVCKLQEVSNTAARSSLSAKILESDIDVLLKSIPDVIDKTAKKYSAYLHDEHMQILELQKQTNLSYMRTCTLPMSKAMSLPPSPRVKHENSSVLDISLFKDAPTKNKIPARPSDRSSHCFSRLEKNAHTVKAEATNRTMNIGPAQEVGSKMKPLQFIKTSGLKEPDCPAKTGSADAVRLVTNVPAGESKCDQPGREISTLCMETMGGTRNCSDGAGSAKTANSTRVALSMLPH